MHNRKSYITLTWPILNAIIYRVEFDAVDLCVELSAVCSDELGARWVADAVGSRNSRAPWASLYSLLSHHTPRWPGVHLLSVLWCAYLSARAPGLTLGHI